MRVSTSQIFDSGTLGIQRNQGSLFKIQNQLSTGRRVLTPEDDPVAAAQTLVVTQAKEKNAQYLDNQATAKSKLSFEEGNLQGVEDELQTILERAVQAGNGSLDASQKGMIAEELKGHLENIVNLANSKDGDGVYLYSGFQGQTQPFQPTGNTGPFTTRPLAATNPYLAYKGDSGQRTLQVGPSQQMAISDSGDDVFMRIQDGQGNQVNRSMFDSIKNLADILDPNSGVPFSQAAYDQALSDIHASLDNVSRVRSSVGSRLAALDGLDATSQDLKVQYEGQVSDLQDLDYAKAISDLSRSQMQLEAAQKSFAQTSQLTLFSVL